MDGKNKLNLFWRQIYLPAAAENSEGGVAGILW